MHLLLLLSCVVYFSAMKGGDLFAQNIGLSLKCRVLQFRRLCSHCHDILRSNATREFYICLITMCGSLLNISIKSLGTLKFTSYQYIKFYTFQHYHTKFLHPSGGFLLYIPLRSWRWRQFFLQNIGLSLNYMTLWQPREPQFFSSYICILAVNFC